MSREPDRRHVVCTEDGVRLAVSVYNVRGKRPDSLKKPLAAVLVHQYSKMGGCQALMRGLAVHLATRGLTVVTYDSRGVGCSTGKATFTGCYEVKDVEAVCRWVHRSLDLCSVLVGSSAGAPIAGSAVDLVPAVKGYVAVGYVFGWWPSWLFGAHYAAIVASRKPKLFIMGERDGFTSVEQLKQRVAESEAPADTVLFPDVGHFGLEQEPYDEPIAEKIMTWVAHNGSKLTA